MTDRIVNESGSGWKDAAASSSYRALTDASQSNLIVVTPAEANSSTQRTRVTMLHADTDKHATSGCVATAASAANCNNHNNSSSSSSSSWGGEGHASIFASSFNLTCNLIGSGMLAMPWTLKESSLISGLLMLGALSIVNGVTMLILAKCCDLARSFSYQKIGTRAMGKHAGIMIQLVMLCYTFSSCLSYVILIGDMVPNAVETLRPDRFGLSVSDLRFYVILIISVAILLPLSFVRNLYSLRFTSAIALGSIMYTMGLTVHVAMHAPASEGGDGVRQADVHLLGFPVCGWRALAVINTGFTAHYNGPQFYRELSKRTLGRFAVVNGLAMGSALIVYTLIACAGYWRYASATQGDLLNNFSMHYVPAIIARLSLAVGMAFSFPLCFHSIRASTFALFAPSLLAASAQTFRSVRYVLVTVALVSFTVMLGVILTQIEVVMSYKGSIFGCAIVYVFPAIMYLRLKTKQTKRKENETRRRKRKEIKAKAAMQQAEQQKRLQQQYHQQATSIRDAHGETEAAGMLPPCSVVRQVSSSASSSSSVEGTLGLEVHRPIPVRISSHISSAPHLLQQQQQAGPPSFGPSSSSLDPSVASSPSPSIPGSQCEDYAYEADEAESQEGDLAYYLVAGNHTTTTAANAAAMTTNSAAPAPATSSRGAIITVRSTRAAVATSSALGAALKGHNGYSSLNNSSNHGADDLDGFGSVTAPTMPSIDDSSLRTVTPSFAAAAGIGKYHPPPHHPSHSSSHHAQRNSSRYDERVRSSSDCDGDDDDGVDNDDADENSDHDHEYDDDDAAAGDEGHVHAHRSRRFSRGGGGGTQRRPNVFVRLWRQLFSSSSSSSSSSSRPGSLRLADSHTTSSSSKSYLDSSLNGTQSGNNDDVGYGSSLRSTFLSIGSSSSDDAGDGDSDDAAPPSWITLDSRGFHIVVWCLLVWGIAVGLMGLAVNVSVQSGGLQQCL